MKPFRVLAIATLATCTLACCQPDLTLAQPNAQPTPRRDPTMECAIRLRSLEQAAFAYSMKHGDRLPPDLYTAMLEVPEVTGRADRFKAGDFISPAHAGLIPVPGELTAQWVNENSSYRYLGVGDLSLKDIPDWDSVVIAHLRLDHGLETEKSPQNPEGELFTVAYLDGHVNLMPLAQAQREIAQSEQILDALRKGTDPPPDRFAVQGLALITRAIRAYAKAHAGKLPPDLGSTYPYVPDDTKATATPQQRARIYLSARVLQNTAIPDEPTVEWINAHCSYLYLGDPQLVLADIPEDTLVLVMGRPDDAFTRAGVDGTKYVQIPVAMVNRSASLQLKAYADWLAGESRRTFAALQAGEPLPEWVDAVRDVRQIGAAIRGYAKAHQGQLPADLGATLEYVPKQWGVTDAAGCARAFLAPRLQLTLELPASVTPEWINVHASYTYLGSAALNTARLDEIGVNVLVHASVSEPYRIMGGDAKFFEAVPAADPFGMGFHSPKEWLIGVIVEAKQRLKSAEGQPPP